MKKVNRKESIIVDSITESLLNLMHKKSFNEISISEVTERAGVGRVSFYRNFDSKEDVLRRYTENLTNTFRENTKLDILKVEVEEALTILFNHLFDQRDFYDLLLKNNIQYIVENEFERIFFFRANNENDYLYLSFLSGGIYKLYYYWALHGYNESPMEIAASIKHNILRGLPEKKDYHF